MPKGIAVYPNPTEDFIRIEWASSVNVTELIVYNQVGNEVLRTKEVENKIDVSLLSAGTYFFRINSDRAHFTEKITIIK